MSIPQHDSQLIRVIAGDYGLRERILGVISQRVEATNLTDSERAHYATPPIDSLSIKVATNAAVFAAIKAAIENGNIADGIQIGLDDNDLTYVVIQELPRLAP